MPEPKLPSALRETNSGNRAFKFTIERHPYEKVVSLAWFRAAPKGDFSQALDEVLKIGYYRNFDLYTIDGKLAVDFIIRYEKMDEDVPKVEKAIGGLPILDRLPRANSDQRKDRRAARDVHGKRAPDARPESRGVVARHAPAAAARRGRRRA